MKVLVIIVSYHFEKWIDRCLGSLRLSEYPVDVTVIDNASKDQTIKRIKKDYPEVRLIESTSNLGFGKANNIGLKFALEEDYDLAFLMNQDAWVTPTTIGSLVTLSTKYPEYGILSPVHLTGKGDKPDPGFGNYACVHSMDELQTWKEIIELPFINAAFWMIPCQVLKKIGGFCPLFYHYGEDKDFINRLYYHHFQIGYTPTSFGNHDREYRPVTYADFLRSESVFHLSEYANIKYSMTKAFCYGVLAIFKKAAITLLKGKFRLCIDYLSMAFRLLGRSKEIFHYRKKNRLSHPHYLTER